MQIGIMPFATSKTMPIVELGVEAERLGFESLFLPEHPVIPAEFETPFPGGGDLTLPKWFTSRLEEHEIELVVHGAFDRIPEWVGLDPAALED